MFCHPPDTMVSMRERLCLRREAFPRAAGPVQYHAVDGGVTQCTGIRAAPLPLPSCDDRWPPLCTHCALCWRVLLESVAIVFAAACVVGGDSRWCASPPRTWRPRCRPSCRSWSAKSPCRDPRWATLLRSITTPRHWRLPARFGASTYTCRGRPLPWCHDGWPSMRRPSLQCQNRGACKVFCMAMCTASRRWLLPERLSPTTARRPMRVERSRPPVLVAVLDRSRLLAVVVALSRSRPLVSVVSLGLSQRLAQVVVLSRSRLVALGCGLHLVRFLCVLILHPLG